MVTEAGEPACYGTAMSVMILETERHATRGHVAAIIGDPGARQTLGNSWRSARYQGCRILRVPVMETRLMSDGSQLKPDQEPDRSGEAVDASVSSATWDSIDHKCSEDMFPRYTVDLRGAHVQVRWGRDGKARGGRQAEHSSSHGRQGHRMEGLTSHS